MSPRTRWTLNIIGAGVLMGLALAAAFFLPV